MTDKRSEGQFDGTTVNVGPEGVHAMDKTGVSKVDLNTGKGLFIPFTMTSKRNPDISFSGSHTRAGLEVFRKHHGEKWHIEADE